MNHNYEEEMIDFKSRWQKWFQVHGWKYKSNSWYKSSEEVTIVLNLQKSAYGPAYYLNVGINLRELDSDDFPKPHKCHIYTRFEYIIRDELKADDPFKSSRAIDDLLDLTKAIGVEDRWNRIDVLLQTLKLKLDQMTDTKTVNKMLHGSFGDGSRIKKEARGVLRLATEK